MAGTRLTGRDKQGNPVVWNGAEWVPNPVRDPSAPGAQAWQGLPATTLDPVALRQQYGKEQADLRADRAALKAHAGSNALMDEFEKANQNANTGSLAARLNPMGLLDKAWSGGSSDYQTTLAKSVNMQIADKPFKGEGAVTEYERRMGALGAPSTDKYGGVNSNIINSRRALNKEYADMLDFKDRYVSVTGSTAGADEVWHKYVSANPYFKTVPVDAAKRKKYGYPEYGKIVAVRPTVPWTKYFGLEAAPKPSAKGKSSFRLLSVEPSTSAPE